MVVIENVMITVKGYGGQWSRLDSVNASSRIDCL